MRPEPGQCACPCRLRSAPNEPRLLNDGRNLEEAAVSRKRVLSVGQCAADHTAISWTLRQKFDVELVPAKSRAEAIRKLEAGNMALVLVNRLLDADGSAGIDVIKEIKSNPKLQATPVMLVSNYADAQAEAVEAGAIDGFGKGSLGDPDTLERVRPYLE